MKKLRTNLKKEDIALSKGYMRWYRVIENEVRLFINERAVNNNKEAVNKIYWKDSRAELCIDSFEYSKKFYEKHKKLDVKLFIKADAGILYSEYEVKSWGLNDKGIEVILTK